MRWQHDVALDVTLRAWRNWRRLGCKPGRLWAEFALDRPELSLGCASASGARIECSSVRLRTRDQTADEGELHAEIHTDRVPIQLRMPTL